MGYVLAFFPILAKIALMVLENYVEKKGADAEGRAQMIALATYLRAKGLKEVRSRFESESQIEAGNAAWDAREKANQKPEEKK